MTSAIQSPSFIRSGAGIKPIYVERTVTYYAINEQEMHSLSFADYLRTILFSLGSSLGSLALGIWISAVFQDKLSPEALVLTRFGGGILIVLCVAAFICGTVFWRRRLTLLEKIREQTAETS